MKIGFVSLGCSKNLVDTERMLYLLAEARYEITPEAEEAEIIVLNTCGFIESAKSESIENIIDLASLKELGQLRALICTGCLAERYREEIMKEMPEVDALLGVGSLEKIVEAVEAVARGEKYTAFLDKEASPLGGDRVLTTPEYTAYLKVAEGCDNRCTYCAIPLIRGKMRSRPIEEIVEEAKDLERLGVKELNLIAQDTTRYGLDLYGEYRLAALVRAITEQTSIPWIRLLYCYPDKITDDLIAELRDNARLVKYMDIPVQHISDGVLKRMNRHGNGDTIREAIARLRASVPGITLRTTVMVGFPGETEQDFEELCAFVKETRFDRFGGFTFSPEEETEAALLPDQIEEEIKTERLDALMEIQLDISAELQANKVGSEILVLAEGYDIPAGIHYGRSAADAPDVDGKIYFSAPKRIAPGTFLRVKITEALDYDLVGEAILD